MTELRKYFAVIFTVLLIGAEGLAAEEPPWWEPLICPEIEPNAPGGSREMARKVELGDFFIELDAVADTYENFNFDEELPPPLSKETLAPNCQWVEFEGYFRPVRYHSYRGQMLADVDDHYLAGGPVGMFAPHFWVQDWNDPSVTSHALHNRRLRIKARVYDQCLAILQYDRQRKEQGFRFGGACHYGENTGMILTEVEVVEVLSPEKVIARLPDLSDVLGDPYKIAKLRYPPVNQEFEPLIPVDGLPPDASRLVRDWLQRVQSGPEAEILREKERETSISEEWRLTQIRELYAHPDGRFGYLSTLGGFASLDPDKAQIKFLATKPFGEWADAPRRWHGYGCIGISPAVSWPVAEIDARDSIATFACTEISLWRDEWHGGY